MVKMRLKTVRSKLSSSTYSSLVECPPSDGEWVACRGMFTATDTLTDESNGPILRSEVFFITTSVTGEGLADVSYDLDELSIVRQNGPSQGIVVPSSIVGKWGVGSEIFLASHTQSWDGDQVRTIESIRPYTGKRGYVVLELNESFARPTTQRESSEFATEVASLSRNIQFLTRETDERFGGHFIVMRTPAVQSIEGVAFQKFGQQGTLGRYPIHFHLSGNVAGSRVAKNLVRESNQRGVVVHGTNNLHVEDNVAYDVFGHCFLLEDGIETGNVFTRNLGARVKNVPKSNLIPDNGQNGVETDDNASVFWMSNVSFRSFICSLGFTDVPTISSQQIPGKTTSLPVQKAQAFGSSFEMWQGGP